MTCKNNNHIQGCHNNNNNNNDSPKIKLSFMPSLQCLDYSTVRPWGFTSSLVFKWKLFFFYRLSNNSSSVFRNPLNPVAIASLQERWLLHVTAVKTIKLSSCHGYTHQKMTKLSESTNAQCWQDNNSFSDFKLMLCFLSTNCKHYPLP